MLRLPASAQGWRHSLALFFVSLVGYGETSIWAYSVFRHLA
jgi:hypothetical protein